MPCERMLMSQSYFRRQQVFVNRVTSVPSGLAVLLADGDGFTPRQRQPGKAAWQPAVWVASWGLNTSLVSE